MFEHSWLYPALIGVCVFCTFLILWFRRALWRTLANSFPKVFISYRSDDTRATSERLYDELRHRLGFDNVFIDERELQPGMNFDDQIIERLRSCDVVFVMVGERWAVEALRDAKDWVRREIQEAINSRIRLIPVLVDRQRMPKEPLPDEISHFAKRSSFRLDSGENFGKDVDRLVKAARRYAKFSPLPSRLLWIDRITFVAALVPACIMLQLLWTEITGLSTQLSSLREASDTLRKASDSTVLLVERHIPLTFGEYASLAQSNASALPDDIKGYTITWDGYVTENVTSEDLILSESKSGSYRLSVHPPDWWAKSQSDNYKAIRDKLKQGDAVRVWGRLEEKIDVGLSATGFAIIPIPKLPL